MNAQAVQALRGEYPLKDKARRIEQLEQQALILRCDNYGITWKNAQEWSLPRNRISTMLSISLFAKKSLRARR
jgi:hypothetical protein